MCDALKLITQITKRNYIPMVILVGRVYLLALLFSSECPKTSFRMNSIQVDHCAARQAEAFIFVTHNEFLLIRPTR